MSMHAKKTQLCDESQLMISVGHFYGTKQTFACNCQVFERIELQKVQHGMHSQVWFWNYRLNQF